MKESIKYDLSELKTLNPVDGEFQDLLNKKIVLQNSAKIIRNSKFCNEYF